MRKLTAVDGVRAWVLVSGILALIAVVLALP
jgi:hypothetical protein